MPELLLELLSEEIPARMQASAAENLRVQVTNALVERGITYAAARAFVTPRRLCLVLDGVLGAQPDQREEKRGPRVGAPDAALSGFLRQVNLTKDQLRQISTDKGDFYSAVIETPGRPTPIVLAEIIPDIIQRFSWPKSMRWGSGDMRWVRPLQSVLCCFDDEVVPFDLGLVPVGDTTLGHRFMAPGRITARKFEEYAERLDKGFVIIDPARRAEIIAGEARQIAFTHHLELVDDPALLDEVVGLVEWPVVLLGSFDPDFLSVPAEVLTTTMRVNQKYFALRDSSGKLAAKFLVVANLEAKDGGDAIVAGNEKVLRARLSDARFFWDQDKKVRLDSRLPALEQIVFHAKLGTLARRVERMMSLAEYLSAKTGADTAQARRAAQLAKADLVTGMVGEFPELQGVMGRYYALADGETAAVADAIRDHYSPLGPNDKVPNAPISIIVALAEKIDTLSGFFSCDEKPTGSKDPFALRRAGLGIIRIILENKLRLNLAELFDYACGLHGIPPADRAGLCAELLSFLTNRLKVYLRDRGLGHDLVAAVYALGNQTDLDLMVRRIEALSRFTKTEDGQNLLAGYRRAANILRIEEKKDAVQYRFADHIFHLPKEHSSLSGYPVFDAEETLFATLNDQISAVGLSLDGEDFSQAMVGLSHLREPIDRFFEDVIVNDPTADIRANRLRLLSGIVSAMEQIADFSVIEK
jgi:glycyl-tRNA synthetase beta chain